MDKLRFGTAGIPLSTPNHNTLNGIARVRQLGLDCLELEFVRSVNITEQKTPAIRDLARKNDVKLTCHGQYYINLNSQEQEKILASKQRIFKAAKIASLCGASSMTFHAAYYMKTDPEKVYQMVKSGIKEVIAKLRDEGHNIIVRPETTGKGSQWGTLKEIIRLSQEVENVLPCIDFSHLYARSIGKDNNYEKFKEMLSAVESGLGREALDNMHIHMSGIEFSDKGEKWHLTLSQCMFNYQALLKVWKEFKVKGCVISESPNIEQDALLMQNEWMK